MSESILRLQTAIICRRPKYKLMKHFPEVVKRLGQKHHKIISNQNNRVVSEWNRENTNRKKITIPGEILENPKILKI